MILEVREPPCRCGNRDPAGFFDVVTQARLDPFNGGGPIRCTRLILLLFRRHVLLLQGIENELPSFQLLTCSQVPIEAVQRDLTFAFFRSVALDAVRFKKRFDVRFETGFS